MNLIDIVKTLKGLRKAGRLGDLPPAEAAYLDTRVLVSTWYPFEDFRALLHRLHRAMGGTRAAAEQMGEVGAHAALTGVHKIFVRPGDPAGTARALERIWSTHFDFGRVCVDEHEGGVRVGIEDYPDLDRVHGLLLVGWIRKALELAGAGPSSVELRSEPWHGDTRFEIVATFEGSGPR